MRRRISLVVGLAIVLRSALVGAIAQGALSRLDYANSFVNSTLARDPCVKVAGFDPTDGGQTLARRPLPLEVVTLDVCSPTVANKMALFLKSQFDRPVDSNPSLAPLQGVRIQVRHAGAVVAPQEATWSLQELKRSFENAFRGNPYFLNVTPVFMGMGAAAVFKPEPVQFFCDDIQDPAGYCHFLAADAFSSLLRHEIGGKRFFYATQVKPTP